MLQYDIMQREHIEVVQGFNQGVTKLNRDMYQQFYGCCNPDATASTPYLNNPVLKSKSKHGHKLKDAFQHWYLEDGLHLTREAKDTWETILCNFLRSYYSLDDSE